MPDYIVVRDRARRYRLGIVIDENGVVTVKAGTAVSDDEIASFLVKQSRWIERHRTKILARKSLVDAYNGETQMYLHGVPTCVEYRDEAGASTYDGSRVIIYTGGRDRREALLNWMSAYAKRYLTEKFSEYAHDICDMAVRWARRYFGICHTSRAVDKSYIHLNVSLVQADEECVRAVIHHEMVHLRVPNHGREFYSELYTIEPDYDDIMRGLSAIPLIRK